MKSRAESTEGSISGRSRKASKVARAVSLLGVSLLAACGPEVQSEQSLTKQDPPIQVEPLATLKKPAPPLRAGNFVNALVCKGYVAHDGNRWVINPIVDKKQADQGDFTPMTVTHNYDVLDINPSMPQDNLTYYDANNKELAKGQKPVCSTMYLKIVNVATDFPNMADPTKPNVTAYYVLPDAYKNASDISPHWGEPKHPNHVYGTNLGQDPLTNADLANFEGTL